MWTRSDQVLVLEIESWSLLPLVGRRPLGTLLPTCFSSPPASLVTTPIRPTVRKASSSPRISRRWHPNWRASWHAQQLHWPHLKRNSGSENQALGRAVPAAA